MRPRPGRIPEAWRESRYASASTELLAGEHVQEAADRSLHLGPHRDEVDHPMLDQKLGALEAFGEGLADRLLDHARTGETDQRLRLRDVQIAEHRVRRGH